MSSPISHERAINRRIGQRLRRMRMDRRVTQRQLGLALGVSHGQIQHYEAGRHRISAAKLAILAELWNIPIALFYDPRSTVAPATLRRRGLSPPLVEALRQVSSM